MGILSTIVVGGIAGCIAKLIIPGKNDPQGFLWTIAIGVLGAVLFTFLARTLGFYDSNEAAGLIGATIGSIILLLGYAKLRKPRIT
ncbi:GlsB/YeaQ/YmgE family stress response membrane protein [Hellea sp.]|nr:GlsB/YeaQ/YmgE family stress response membrane protein [Hellea sp.]